jgi:uncharacterized RDD family membrane protein YckC
MLSAPDPGPLRVETSDNIGLDYPIAGLGSRFLAFALDTLILGLSIVLITILFLAVAISKIIRETNTLDDLLYVAGIFSLVSTSSSFLYFGLQERYMAGQTLGKKALQIRVVSTDGATPSGASVLIRTLFRVFDNLPITWLVPLFTRQHQRLGDLVAQTVVIHQVQAKLSPLREALLQRTANDALLRWDSTRLGRLSPEDYDRLEQLLERTSAMDADLAAPHLNTACRSLCQRLGTDLLPTMKSRDFLEDLMAAELRRRQRRMG